ncbi:hypothetical protein [Anaerotignum sp. MB30-C6]|uniref:hypothetical protein n=1 Tax=Anaerotignum sp. MB30-C6 TaxID=3070814 RepID=UPI0027DD6F8F|nr:hypothetical protein [Anaerotignum sp. MB30-C6]WMI82190.1 hypothetical protein RBQ60_05495 [Anaerotignum sp. MB30-C6]
MVDGNALRKKISEHDFTEEKLAEMLGMSQKIFNAKLRSCGSCFSIKEAKKIVIVLELEGKEAARIFFA